MQKTAGLGPAVFLYSKTIRLTDTRVFCWARMRPPPRIFDFGHSSSPHSVRGILADSSENAQKFIQTQITPEADTEAPHEYRLE